MIQKISEFGAFKVVDETERRISLGEFWRMFQTERSVNPKGPSNKQACFKKKKQGHDGCMVD